MKFVNPQKLCEASQKLDFIIDLKDFTRLEDLISQVKQPFAVDLNFTKNQNKFVVLGSLTGVLVLTCQRCLNPFDFTLNTNFKWRLVEVDAQDTDEFADFDNLQTNLTRLNLLDVLEDELIMAMPFVPVCNLTTCKLDGYKSNAKTSISAIEVLEKNPELTSQAPKDSPFAILQNLKFAKK